MPIPLVAAALSLLASTPGAPPEAWELVWSDEFEGTTLDASKWNAEDAALMNNKELQYYTPDAVRVGGGVLTITAEKRSLNGREYTSGLVDSRGKFSMAFGKFECRAKLPRGQGMWPAVWMLPQEDRWPPEIDIMENLGQEPHRIHTTHHWGAGWPNNSKTGSHFDGPDYSADFHTFAVEWSPEKIDWLIDGTRVFTSTTNIPVDPFYFIINLAVGGNWGGNPDQSTVFPQTLQIDWVRIYRSTATDVANLLTDSPNGDVFVSPKQWTFKPGERAQLRADPDIGYVFKGWSGDASGNANPLDLDMKSSRRVQAVFEPDPNAPRLLSRGAKVTASGSEGLGLEPERAVDGSLWSRWGTPRSDMLWFQIDLGESREISAIRLAWASRMHKYVIETSETGTSWTELYLNNARGERLEKIRNLKGKGRYVRLTALPDEKRGRGGASLFSFDLYGK